MSSFVDAAFGVTALNEPVGRNDGTGPRIPLEGLKVRVVRLGE